MSYVFHESRVVVIETSRRVVRAVLGLGELLHTPSVVCRPSFPLKSSTTRHGIFYAHFTMAYHNPRSRKSWRVLGCADPS